MYTSSDIVLALQTCLIYFEKKFINSKLIIQNENFILYLLFYQSVHFIGLLQTLHAPAG